jgi:Zn-dependent alcohol dehydrogenase
LEDGRRERKKTRQRRAAHRHGRLRKPHHLTIPSGCHHLILTTSQGVCHTDVLIGNLPDGAAPIAFYPRVLGHEGSGYVREIGPGVTVAKPGDAVLLSYAFCTSCDSCASAHHSHCTAFNELNFGKQPGVFGAASDNDASIPTVPGAFFGQSSFASLSIARECSVVNASSLVSSKEELQLLSPLGCGVQTGAGTVINVAQASEKDVVCVLGLGGVGLSAVMGAKIQNARIIIGVDRVGSRLELAKEMGATHVIDSSKLKEGQTLVEAVREVADGLGPTVTVDTTGVPALIQAAVDFARNRGKIIQVGSAPFDFKLELTVFDFMVRGLQYIGAIEGQAYPSSFVPKMVQWRKEGKFPVDKMMKLMPADQFEAALHEMHEGKTIKPILCW